MAHEIRNPLAAIAQANALLAEDLESAVHRRLTAMVADNVERLKRIVDDVMAAASGPAGTAPPIDARAEVAAACAEWCRTAGVAAPAAADGADADGALLRLDLPATPVGVTFDAEHLRRVLVNLLDNARRHGSGTPGAIAVRLRADDGAAEATLGVASDGAPIAPEVERFLFEPFFSTRSRGTGLGLHICRELCQRHGATIDFRLRPDGERRRNEFVVALRRAGLGAAMAPPDAPPSDEPPPP